jgi:hypothetical protein
MKSYKQQWIFIPVNDWEWVAESFLALQINPII